MKTIYWIILTVTFSSVPVLSDSTAEHTNARYYGRYFEGWKGIVFLCSFNDQDKILEQIYRQALAEIKVMASTNHVQLIVARENDLSSASALAKSNGFIILEYDLLSTLTKGDDAVKVIQARLFYKINYLNAVENNEMPTSLRGLPRPGNLEIWERTQIGKGHPDRIAASFADHAKKMFSQAIDLFSKHSR